MSATCLIVEKKLKTKKLTEKYHRRFKKKDSSVNFNINILEDVFVTKNDLNNVNFCHI